MTKAFQAKKILLRKDRVYFFWTIIASNIKNTAPSQFLTKNLIHRVYLALRKG